MPAFQPTAEQYRTLRDDPHKGPIAQVNILKFKLKAEYKPDDPEYGENISGAEAYRRYAEGFAPAAAEVGGQCLLMGKVQHYFIGKGDYDMVMVMHFPSRIAFIKTLNHPSYDTIKRHRDAGLLCQELISTEVLMASGLDGA